MSGFLVWTIPPYGMVPSIIIMRVVERLFCKFFVEGSILAQDERWRRA